MSRPPRPPVHTLPDRSMDTRRARTWYRQQVRDAGVRVMVWGLLVADPETRQYEQEQVVAPITAERRHVAHALRCARIKHRIRVAGGSVH